MALATFSGNGSYQIDVDGALVSQSGTISTIYWRIVVRKNNSFGHSGWGGGSSGWADGNPGRIWNAGNLDYNFQNGSNSGTFLIADGQFNVQHRADGNAEYYIAGGLEYVGLGKASANTGWRSLPRIQTATVPQGPTAAGIDQITMTSMRYRFSGNSDGGSPIREWEVVWGTDPNNGQFSARGSSVSNGLLTVSVAPGTRYYFWSRGRNDVGWGPWSGRMDARSLAGAFIKHNGVWREAVFYIKQNGAWRPAQPYTKVNGTWRKMG